MLLKVIERLLCPPSAEIDIRPSQVDPRTERLKYFSWLKTHNIGIQMKRKGLPKTLCLYKNILALQGLM